MEQTKKLSTAEHNKIQTELNRQITARFAQFRQFGIKPIDIVKMGAARHKEENPNFKFVLKAPKGASVPLVLRAILKAHAKGLVATDRLVLDAEFLQYAYLTRSEQKYAADSYQDYLDHLQAVAEAKAERAKKAEADAKVAAENQQKAALADATEKALADASQKAGEHVK